MGSLFFLPGRVWRSVLGGWISLAALSSAPALELHRERNAPTDLMLTGRIAGVPRGEARYVRWSELRALPTTRLRLTGEFVAGEQEVTAIFLEDLWKQLPLGDNVDLLLATCGDGYASVYRQDFIHEDRPFLVLEINGQGPDHWPPPGLHFNPAPYVISVSASIAPAVAQLIDPGHKKPWGTTTLELANFEERFGAIYRGARADLSAPGAMGREIWINSCASCHEGPAQIFGGSKSGQPFAVVQAIAVGNPDFFKKYVRNPKAMMPTAKMEPHPHYTDAQLEALIAFIAADRPG